MRDLPEEAKTPGGSALAPLTDGGYFNAIGYWRRSGVKQGWKGGYFALDYNNIRKFRGLKKRPF